MVSPLYDVVIIGAGPSGLAAGARLAHFGVKVCVLEAHNRIGGLNSWHHVGGREISSGLHAFTNYSPDGRGGPLGKLLRQLRLKYADLHLRPQRRSSIRFPGVELAFTNDPQFFRGEVAEKFPASIDAFDRFRRFVADTDEGEMTRSQTSARAVLESYIADPLLVDMLFCPVMFYGNPGGVGDGHDAERGVDRPDMDWLLFCVVWKCIFESGFAHPAGGMRPLWELLARRITENGGEVRLSARVERLVTGNGGVTGARLVGGEEIVGKAYFSSAGGPETEGLLGLGPERERPAGGISIIEGIRLLTLPPADWGLTDTIIFYSLRDRLRFGRPEGLVETENGVVCASGNYLPPDAADAEANILKVSALASSPRWRELAGDRERYVEAKRKAGEGLGQSLGRLGLTLPPGREGGGRFGGFDDLFTPVTLERYTLHRDGALYGSPVKSRDGETGYGNLFLMGTDQGFHGIVGAMLSGVAMVNRHWLARE